MLHLSTDMCALVLQVDNALDHSKLQNIVRKRRIKFSQYNQKELEFWHIDELTIEPCCALKYYPEIEQVTIVIFP